MTTSEKSVKKIDARKHWDEIYQHKDEKTLGWYQEISKPSLDLIQDLKIGKDKRILIVGSGTTRLVDNLLEKGYKSLFATDISKVALINLETRLTSHQHQNLKARLRFIVDDLRSPSVLNILDPMDLWHDRAVLHYFTDEEERKSYISLLKKLVKKDGVVIIAVYNKQSPSKSAGLKIINYNQDELANLLGSEFKLVKSFDYDYKQPSGNIRKYVYVAFKRIRIDK